MRTLLGLDSLWTSSRFSEQCYLKGIRQAPCLFLWTLCTWACAPTHLYAYIAHIPSPCWFLIYIKQINKMSKRFGAKKKDEGKEQERVSQKQWVEPSRVVASLTQQMLPTALATVLKKTVKYYLQGLELHRPTSLTMQRHHWFYS